MGRIKFLLFDEMSHCFSPDLNCNFSFIMELQDYTTDLYLNILTKHQKHIFTTVLSLFITFTYGLFDNAARSPDCRLLTCSIAENFSNV
jgi:hypothetical protein